MNIVEYLIKNFKKIDSHILSEALKDEEMLNEDGSLISCYLCDNNVSFISGFNEIKKQIEKSCKNESNSRQYNLLKDYLNKNKIDSEYVYDLVLCICTNCNQPLGIFFNNKWHYPYLDYMNECEKFDTEKLISDTTKIAYSCFDFLNRNASDLFVTYRKDDYEKIMKNIKDSYLKYLDD